MTFWIFKANPRLMYSFLDTYLKETRSLLCQRPNDLDCPLEGRTRLAANLWILANIPDGPFVRELPSHAEASYTAIPGGKYVLRVGSGSLESDVFSYRAPRIALSCLCNLIALPISMSTQRLCTLFFDELLLSLIGLTVCRNADMKTSEHYNNCTLKFYDRSKTWMPSDGFGKSF